MMEKNRAWIGKLVMEFASVVFAVLLALGLNHWRESIAEQKVADKALLYIFLEIRANQRDVEAEISSYQERLEEVKVYKDSFDKGEGMRYSLGFNIPLLSKAAWNVANSTGAVKDFDQDLLLELSGLYTFQEMYQSNGMDYMKYMSSIEYKKEENAKAIINSNYGQIRTFERWSNSLSDAYLDFIKTFGPRHRDILPDSVMIQPDITTLDANSSAVNPDSLLVE